MLLFAQLLDELMLLFAQLLDELQDPKEKV